MASLEPRKQLIGTWEAAGGQPMRIQFTNQNRLIITRPGSMPKDIEFDSSYWKLSVGRHRVQVNKDSPGGPFYEDRWETVLDARLLSETELVLTFDKVKSDTDKYRFLEGRFSRIDYNKVRTHEDTIEPPR